MVNKKVVQTVLAVLGISGLFVLAAIAPNTLQLLKFALPDKDYRRKRYYINQVVERLAKKGLVTFIFNSQGVKCARLTNLGRQQLRRYQLKELTITIPKRWDGKYRLVIFDIEEWKRGVRDDIRHWLEHLNFVRLQNSVWVYPYECQEVVALLKSHFHVGKEVLYLTVESIENDYWLKREFGLS